jgi:NAD(P)H-flavin reductase
VKGRRPGHMAECRTRAGRIVLLVGARTPGDLLYADELEGWRRDGVEVAVTVASGDLLLTI